MRVQIVCDSLQAKGYRVQCFSGLNDVVGICDTSSRPDVVVVDMESIDDGDEGLQTIKSMRTQITDCPPLVIISNKQDIESRLAAVRAGASHYLSQPLDIEDLVETLDEVTKADRHAPYRILLIDGDDVSLNEYSSALKKAGMEAKILNRPLDALTVISDYKPDLVLLDADMHECSGYELSRVIRQDHAYAQIPIVFMSNGSGKEQRMMSIEAGGDDFLSKPVSPENLIAVVQSRAHRASWIKRLNVDLKSALRESESLHVAMDYHSIVSVTNVAGRITSINDKFCEISGYQREELLGQNHRILKSGHHSPSFYDNLWNTISAGEVWHGVLCNLKKDGSEYWVESTIVPFLDEAGLPYQYVSVRTDVTSHRINQERLLRSHSFANIGTWDWNIRTGDLHWSERIGPLFGYEDNVPETSYENFIKAVHPEDRDQVVAAVNDCVENSADYNIEHRVVWPDGTVRWMLERGDVLRGERGEPIHMLGVVQDITERHTMQEQLERQRMLLDMLHQSTTNFVGKGDFVDAMKDMLNTLLSLTDSEYGFTGEVLYDEDGAPYLRTHSITDIAWNDETRALYEEFHEKGFEFRNLDTLFGLVMTSRDTVMSNDPANDPRAGGLPEGHPDMSSFLGVPVFYGNELVGMYGIANRKAGYDKTIEDFLRPFNTTYGVMIHSKRIMDLEEHHKLELINAKEDAENANRAKSQFLSSMSHELRTPLNAIMGFGQLLQMRKDLPLHDVQRENVDEIIKAGKHLLELINEVLDLARIEAGRINFSIEAIALDEVIVESLQLIMPSAKARNITVGITHDGVEITSEKLLQQGDAVRADSTRLKQVLLNLLNNAVKYNNENGNITIDCCHINDQTRISIIDTGNGLTPEQQKELFEPFHRMGAENSNIEGTGIGLVITKNIIELMGGNIGFESETGVGSTFWIELPTDQQSKKQKNGTDADDSQELLLSIKKQHEHTVLYIEDNPTNLRLVSQVLGRQPDIHMWSAHEPMLGIELALQNKPHLILLDINLPGISGYDVLKQLGLHESTRDIPVIAISANAMPSDIKRGLKAGFTDYITKPIDIDALLQAVNKALSEKTIN